MFQIPSFTQHLALTIGILWGPTAVFAQNNPDILVLGDSQISQAGGAYVQFFENLGENCNLKGRKKRKLLSALGQSRTAAIGVRSTSLHSWSAREGQDKATICDVDKRYGVNAGVFGVGGDPKRSFVQIGNGREYQFCRPIKSAFEAAFENQYYDPKLLVLAFVGNAAERWAENPRQAEADVRATLSQIPSSSACIFMTTIPVYSKTTNDLRIAAQQNIKAAFAQSGQKCRFVEGFTLKTRQSIEGNSRYFQKRKDGSIKDPFHPSAEAAELFFEIISKPLCKAVLEIL